MITGVIGLIGTTRLSTLVEVLSGAVCVVFRKASGMFRDDSIIEMIRVIGRKVCMVRWTILVQQPLMLWVLFLFVAVVP